MLSHRHTAKVAPHYHTSYASLMFLLVLAIILVIGMSWSAMAAPANPQSGSVGLSGTVKGPPPSTAATITVPVSGSSITAIPITVAGACPSGTFITITKNNVFGGVASCQDNGTYSMLVDLFAGNNVLVARISDALGQYGPDSLSISIFYDAPDTSTAGAGQGRQLFLNMATTVVAGNPGDQIGRTLTIIGGVGPYAVNWEWGDDTSSLMSVTGEGPVNASHVYSRAGTYRVIARVTDKFGNNAYVQFVTVINGPAAAIGTTSRSGLGALPGSLVAVWPILAFMLVLVIAFWMGERRQQYKLNRHKYST